MLQSLLSDNVTLSQQPLRALICLFVKWWEWSKWLWGSASTLKSGVLPCQISINIQPLHCAEESRRPRNQMGIRPHCAPSLSHHLRQHDASFYVPACLGHREPRRSVKRYSENVCEGDSGWDWQQTEWSRPPSAAWLGLTPPTNGTGRTERLRKGEFTFHLPHWPHLLSDRDSDWNLHRQLCCFSGLQTQIRTVSSTLLERFWDFIASIIT